MSQDSKYQKQRQIGSSDRVDVYLGLNVAFGRKVAIKELRGGVDTSAADRNSFFGEFEKWAKLEHPRIARIEDLDRTRAWVIQEYLPQSITDLAVKGNPVAAYHAMDQMLEGLNFLHQSGLLHFNLKSSNVRAVNDTIKLCDGRCIPIGFPGSLPKPRGSNRYLAPEMINEEFGNVGTATDIYVAGMIMLESLAGNQFESLFKGYVLGTPDTEIGWVRWHNSPETLDPIQRTLPYVPPALATLIEGMICKQVAVRYSSVERLLTDLRSQREAIVNAEPMAVPTRETIPASATFAPAPAAAAPVHPGPAAPAGSSKPADNRVKLIDRPNSPTYVRCLSGTLAGTVFPTSMGEISIGEGSHCTVKISQDLCPQIAGREIKIWLGNNGWLVSDTLEHPVIVDSKTSFQAAPLRSGSIFRLSPQGPDFQFVVQGQHETTWQDIAAELALTGADSSEQDPGRPGRRPGSKAAATAKPAATKPTAAAPQPAPAPRPAAAAPAAPAQRSPLAGSQPAAPATVPARPAGSPAPSAPSAPGNTSHNAPVKAGMDKNKRNNLILFISLPIIAILIILFMPQSQSAKKADGDKTEENKKADEDSKQPEGGSQVTESKTSESAVNGKSSDSAGNSDDSVDSAKESSENQTGHSTEKQDAGEKDN